MSRLISRLTEAQKDARRANDRARSGKRLYANLSQEQIAHDRERRRRYRRTRTAEQKEKERENNRLRCRPERHAAVLTPGQKAERIEAARARKAARASAWRRANPERVKALKRAAYLKHREKKLKKDRAYRLATLEQHREYDRKRNGTPARKAKARVYAISHPERVRAAWENRRARTLGAIGHHSAQNLVDLYLRQRGVCSGCECLMPLVGKCKYHVDHIMPLVLGGSNWPDNLQLLCPSCNHKKHAAHPDVWERVIKPRIKQQRSEVAA